MPKLQEYRPGKYRFKIRGRLIYLPGMAKRDAESVLEKVTKLSSIQSSGSIIPERIALWLSEDCPDELYDRLVAIELAPPRARRVSSLLGRFVDEYIAGRKDVSPNTTRAWNQARDHLVDVYGEEMPLQAFTASDAMKFRHLLLADEYAEATVRKWCGYASHFFEQAVDAELLSRNPFRKVPTGSVPNEDRAEFIDRPTIEKVIKACPDAEWRLIVALARYGGFRIPSESNALKWNHINFAEGTILVHSPKTKKQGKPWRLIPLFPELEKPLRDAFEQAAEGSESVISRYRGDNIRETFTRIVKRAGVEPWPRIFQNLRASRETELADQFPVHVVCAWIGNTEKVARRHYLQVTDEHFDLGRAGVAQSEEHEETLTKTPKR